MVLAAVIAGSGCAPSCEHTCRKVLACDLGTERIAQQECVDSCEAQDALYQSWDDEEKIDAFDDHRRCLVQSSCDEIADGACYDEDLFVF